MRITEIEEGRFVDEVSEDEPCAGLYEGNFFDALGITWNRYQVVYVLRDVPDEIEKKRFAHITKMGRADIQPYPEQRLIAWPYGAKGEYDTVGDIRETAALTRMDHTPRLPEQNADVWVKDNLDDQGRKREALLNRTQFGFGHAASLEQRNR